MDQHKLNEFLGRFVSDLGATIAAGSTVIGHRLGLYRAQRSGLPRRRSWRPEPTAMRGT